MGHLRRELKQENLRIIQLWINHQNHWRDAWKKPGIPLPTAGNVPKSLFTTRGRSHHFPRGFFFFFDIAAEILGKAGGLLNPFLERR